jgi:hypothetical protein
MEAFWEGVVEDKPGGSIGSQADCESILFGSDLTRIFCHELEFSGECEVFS